MAEGLQLPHEAVGFAGGVDALVVVVRGEVVVAGGRVGEQVPDDHQDGAGNGDEGLALASVFDYAPIAFGEEGWAAAGSGGGGQTEDG